MTQIAKIILLCLGIYSLASLLISVMYVVLCLAGSRMRLGKIGDRERQDFKKQDAREDREEEVSSSS